VDQNTRRVRGIPDLELELDVEGDIAKRAAFKPDIGPLPIAQPGHVIGRPDVDVVAADIRLHLRLAAVRLRDLLRNQALATELVEEVGVAAEVEPVGPLELDVTVVEQPRSHAGHYGR